MANGLRDLVCNISVGSVLLCRRDYVDRLTSGNKYLVTDIGSRDVYSCGIYIISDIGQKFYISNPIFFDQYFSLL